MAELFDKFRIWILRSQEDRSALVSLHSNALSNASIASTKWLLCSAAVLAIGHTLFLLSIMPGMAWNADGETAIWIFVTPLLVFGLWDFRSALLLSIVATPLFNAPVVPHFFTQGIGDLFALAAVIGFLFRHFRQCHKLFSGPQVLFLLIPFATFASIFFNFPDLDRFRWEKIKYEVAELCGLILAVVYSLLLASAIRCQKDLRILIAAVFFALIIGVISGLVSFGLISACVLELKGTPMSPGGQLSGGFGNPNYFGSWMIGILPICMYLFDRRQVSRLNRWGSALLLLLISTLLLLTVSRSALLALLFLLLVWIFLAANWQSKFFALVILMAVIISFPVAWNYRFAACSGQVGLDYQKNTLSVISRGTFGYLVVSKEEVLLEDQTNAEGLRHPKRAELLVFGYEAWKSSPLFGVGPGNLSSIVHDRTGVGERAHNVAATVLAEQGALGLLVWFVLWSVLLLRVLCLGWGRSGAKEIHPTFARYLFLMFLSLSTTSLFADQYRVIWLWQLVALVLSHFFSADDGLFSAYGKTKSKY